MDGRTLKAEVLMVALRGHPVVFKIAISLGLASFSHF